MKKIKVAIVGAAGYSGEELLRILVKHPECNITVVTSRKYDSKPISEVFPRFADSELCFSAPNVKYITENADVVFLALPHGLATEFAIPFLKAGMKVIDISADFRLRDPDIYKKYYKTEHPAPELLLDAVYGLPEIYRNQIKNTSLIACAGCYPTSILLPSIPLLRENIVTPTGIVVASMSGVSGAGRKVDLPYIFPECNESVRPYAVSGHRHLSEIEQELSCAADSQVKINFIPHLIPVNRGINSSIIYNLKDNISYDDIVNVYDKYYKDEKFVRVLSDGKLPDTKHVTLTNVCEFAFTIDDHTGNLIVNSVIDNLTKGASGQAVQCMNIIFDLPENIGL
jgi:N-acetyl-gamma-glutamyl-phosphate reductase